MNGARYVAAFAVDSSSVIAAVSDWHDARDPTRREIDRRLDTGEDLVLPAAALVEAYSVLTRLPVHRRLSPADAWKVLEPNFVSKAHIQALEAATYAALIARLAAAGIGGGRVYDEVIAETAAQAGASALITLNPKHFPSPPPGLAIVDPAAVAR